VVRAGSEVKVLFGFVLFVCLAGPAPSQTADANLLNRSGEAVVNGRATPYLIRHLPVNAFPQLPASVQSALMLRDCLIPQTYEAHRPENVVNASLERHGSSDWAVLCSANGKVSLLVFFGRGGDPMVLATEQETDRLQEHGASPALGFDWAIDQATPETLREAQFGADRSLPVLDHDALADSVIEEKTIYRAYLNGAWKVIDPEN
jgi:hypothetical protein